MNLAPLLDPFVASGHTHTPRSTLAWHPAGRHDTGAGMTDEKFKKTLWGAANKRRGSGK
jgi:hypothetical protein